MNNSKDTKNILLESNSVYIFPESGSIQAYVYYLKTHHDFKTNDISNFMNIKSRWICLRHPHNLPAHIVWQKGIRTVKDLLAESKKK